MEQTLTDSQLADELIRRLNAIIKDEDVRALVEQLVERRIEINDAVLQHPTIQASRDAGKWGVGLLGILNGLVGVHGTSKNAGWGYIAATFDDNMKLVGFKRTDGLAVSLGE
jgi:hypothetical protein